MYKRETNTESEQIELVLDDLALSFPDRWDYENRWVKLGGLIPWDRFEKNYADLFTPCCTNINGH